MSKMDHLLNSKKDKQTIYEIYRACRLCGAGAGYKMPIIQNVVDVDDTDVELKQKIRECVQIEVHQDDKMPPLICELCVDKVNDFYEFFEMCRQTNKRTRLRLGLPPQSMPRGTLDAGECILGLTEPVFVNDDSDVEPLAKHKKLQPKVKIKREPELKVKIERGVSTDSRPSRHRSSQRSRTPPRMTRHSKHLIDDNVSLSRRQDKSKSTKVMPRSILKKESKTEENSLLMPRLKRSRDKEPVKLETPVKKVKIAMKPTPHSTPKSSPRISQLAKLAKRSPKRAPSPPPRTFNCTVCGQANKTPQANGNHMRTHIVTFTSPRLACNPCGLWFLSADEASSHHKHHRSKSKPYNCRRCTSDFKYLSAYDEHFENNQCIPLEEVPDVKCEECWHLFATNKLFEDHRCLGEDHRPGGKCGKCKRSYALLKNLKKHEENCTAKRKGELVVDPVLLGKLRPIQVRVSRCDPLLGNIKQEHYDVSNVTADFGLDKNCYYPYISSVSSLSIKSEPDFHGMVAIEDEIKEEFCTEEDYVHWDSEDSESDDDITCQLVLNPIAKLKKVDTLATLTLKTLFSQRCLGKVPRKRRRVKQEKSVFDSILGNDSDDKVTRDINNIIDNLGDDDDELDGDESKKDDKSQKENDKNEDGNDTINNDDDKIIMFDDIDEKSTDFDADSRNGVDSDAVDRDDEVKNEIADIVNIETDAQDKNNFNVKTSNNDVSTESTKDNDKVNIDQNITNAETVSNDQNISQDESAEKNLNGPSNDLCEKNSSNHEENNSDSKNDGNSKCIDGSPNSNKVNIKEDNIKVNNGSTNVSFDNKLEISKGEDSIVNEVESRVNEVESGASEVESTVNEVETLVNKVESKENDENCENDTESMKNDAKTDFDDCIDNSQDSNSIGTFNESLLNDNTQSDVISESEKEREKDFNAKCVNDNATSMSEVNSENDEIKSRQNYFSMENLSQDSKMSDLDMNLNLDSKSNDSTLKNDGIHMNSNNSDSVNEKKTVNTEKISKNSTDTEDMDDSKLMEALDAQIGDTNDEQRHGNEENENINDKIALEDLISAKNPVKPLDMDSLPDDYNFDA